MIGKKHDFFHWIISDMIETLIKTDDDRVKEHYDNPLDKNIHSPNLLGNLKDMPAISLNKAFK